MIDRESERVIPLREIPKMIPSRVSGKTLSLATVWRWVLRPTDPLETIMIGGGRFTSIEALDRFIAKGNRINATPPSESKSNAKRAGEKLRRLIGGDGKAA
jgi:hypothetical protein